MSVTPVQPSSQQRTLLPTILKWRDQQQEVVALIDSGAEENFMDSCFVAQWGLPTIELRTPMMANALNGQKLAKITQASVPVDLCLSGNHHEQVSFFHY